MMMSNSDSQGDSWIERELETMLDIDMDQVASAAGLPAATMRTEKSEATAIEGTTGGATTATAASARAPPSGAATAAATTAPADDDATHLADLGAESDDGLGKDEQELFGSDFGSDDEGGKTSAKVPSAASAQAPSAAATSAAGAAAAAAAASPRPPPPSASPSSPTPRPASSQRTEEPEAAAFVDESRFTKDQHGNSIYKWRVEYATRAGGGRAQCRDDQCLERSEQGGVKTIEKGALRICRRVFREQDNTVIVLWYHARCMFNAFTRSRKGTRVIETAEDLEGFADIRAEDQEYIRRLIAGNRDARGKPEAGGAAPPLKRSMDRFEEPVAPKKPKLLEEIKLMQGDRVWIYCRVRPAAADGAGPADVIRFEKSAKPELAMIVQEPVDGHVVVQFESADHEKERVEKFNMKRHARIRAWLRYPRYFEGKKQRLPVSWINKARVPPRLCSCVKQEWGHNCRSGISCGRGTRSVVFGLDL